MNVEVIDGMFVIRQWRAVRQTLIDLGMRMHRGTHTYQAPASIFLFNKLRERFTGLKVAGTQQTHEMLEHLKHKASIMRFMHRYLRELTEGKRKPDYSRMRFKNGATPYAHQGVALDYAQHTDNMALFWDCGLGKTFVVCQWAQYLADNYGLKKCLVIAPRSALHTTWMEDIKKFTWLDATVLDQGTKVNAMILQNKWPAKSRKKEKYQKDFKIYVMNYESVAPLMDTLLEEKFDLLVIDESTKIKNPKAKRSKALVELSMLARRKVIMAGLPAPNAAYDLFMQVKALSPEYFGHHHTAFMMEHYMPRQQSLGDGKYYVAWDIKAGAPEKIKEVVARCGFRLEMKDSGVELPGHVCVTREAYLPQTVFDVYKKLVKECMVYLNGKPVYAEGIAKIMKLREVTSQFVMDNNSQAIDFNVGGAIAKVDTLLEILEDEIGPSKSVVIWAHFIKEYDILRKALKDKLIVLADYSRPEEAIAMFKNRERLYLVANPASMSHSVNLQGVCNHMVWFSYSYSSEFYYQAVRRIVRIGQQDRAIIYHIVAVGPKRQQTIDQILLNVIDSKLQKNDDLMGAFKKGLADAL